MIVEERIKRFERMGIGMFVHFGAYSVIGKGEWAKKILNIPWEEYDEAVKRFIPKESWAEELVETAALAGAKYITLTTRHHDGFSLYDTCGLNSYDAPHVSGRDYVREFVDACRKRGIIPFFYHTLLDWHEESFDTDFPEYLKYLRASVEILCRNYGEIGGFWFDGKWSKPDEDWEEDKLYSLIRSYQPDTMIINNTGLSARGELGNPQLDSVTFERGRPAPINLEGSSKYIASEMCQIFADHWGYAKGDIAFKSMREIIRDFVTCRRYGSNYLINVGPTEDGSLRPYDKIMIETLGKWCDIYREMLSALPSGCEVENRDDAFVLKGDDAYYMVFENVQRSADPNVAVGGVVGDASVKFDGEVKRIFWLDNGEELSFSQGEDGRLKVHPTPFHYGESLCSRVAKIVC